MQFSKTLACGHSVFPASDEIMQCLKCGQVSEMNENLSNEKNEKTLSKSKSEIEEFLQFSYAVSNESIVIESE